METSIIATSNVTNFQECVSELVLNSLDARATAIAIRFDLEKRKIQVVDNGVGISKKKLIDIAEYRSRVLCWNVEDICNAKKQTLVNIRRLSDAVIITSRHCSSSRTYTKVCKVGCSPKIVKVQGRPSSGTTVTVYGFHELTFHKWNVPLTYLMIGNIAIVNPQVSFSIRDDQERRLIMAITKPHKPMDIFKLLYYKEVSFNNLWYINNMNDPCTKFHAFIGFSNRKSNAIQYIFLNNRPVHCPLIRQVISNAFINALKLFVKAGLHQIPKRKAIFILLFISCTEHIFTLENRKKTLILPSVRNLLLSIQNEIETIFLKDIKPLSSINSIKLAKKTLLIKTPVVPKFQDTTIDKSNVNIKDNSLLEDCEQIKTVHEMTINQLPVNEINNIQSFTHEKLSRNVVEETSVLALTQWSNWTYHDDKSQKLKEANEHNNSALFYKRFDFLPKKLHKLLRGNTKLTKTDVLNDWGGSDSSARLRSGLDIPDILLHQETDVRPCEATQRFHEFKLKKELLKFVTVLGQVNNELIVGLAVKNDTKMLLLMDQHAIHERIRYENLLNSKYNSSIINIFMIDNIIIHNNL
ncbi:uncharacterized protein LOC116428374 [Nomia melanderi]|uniref:uncharacterized protein LOC116428374 n=1 Tax=Nomia melanderi TaxID=2448451 RepID=UPI003FCCBCE8